MWKCSWDYLKIYQMITQDTEDIEHFIFVIEDDECDITAITTI